MELVAVIMAGGVGSRFWPKSRAKEPKQLLNLFSASSMIQNTVERMKGLVRDENIFIITNKIQKVLIAKQLPQLPIENIIEEPFGKNTAAAIGLASIIIDKKIKDAVTIVLPADHLINDTKEFQRVIKEASDFAYIEKSLVTIGINPTRPDTGYGYIQIDEIEAQTFHKVIRFAEKPNYDTAKRFLEAGDFFWNSGMFIWRVDVILCEIAEYMPDLYEGIQTISQVIGTSDYDDVLAKVYGQLKSISIDYGIMEKSHNVRLIKGKFDWSDVGSWDAVYHLLEKDNKGNVGKGDVYFGNTNGTYVNSENKFTAVIGVNNLLVINTDDATLVCHRDYAQDVKLIVDYLKMNKKDELL
ncbi:MAG: mannose-1-phosphate guanylyltransferase [Ignavibacteriales bacterium CG18_big_fil_WC_8_21_14_2_50_31_20]|nr:MAG: mannose-1-phosphate guanylyltransferase [Ignavibacteriales bacterium CG18_big_fil_WC_8_21_14_2_50_31_20]